MTAPPQNRRASRGSTVTKVSVLRIVCVCARACICNSFSFFALFWRTVFQPRQIRCMRIQQNSSVIPTVVCLTEILEKASAEEKAKDDAPASEEDSGD